MILIIISDIGAIYKHQYHFGPTWYVSETTVASMDRHNLSIQTAIDASSAGDTILVQPGVYTENISIVSKNIYMKGEDP